MLNLITQFLMQCIRKMRSKYLLVKFDMNYIFYTIFKIPIYCVTSLLAVVRYRDF